MTSALAAVREHPIRFEGEDCRAGSLLASRTLTIALAGGTGCVLELTNLFTAD